MWQEGGDGGSWGHTCGALAGRAWQEIRASSGGPARGPGTGMQDLRLRKRDGNMGYGTRIPCTAQARPGLRMWGQRLQMPARLQPPGQHRRGLAGAWACSGARVGWRRCGVKGLKGEHPDPGHSPDQGTGWVALGPDRLWAGAAARWGTETRGSHRVKPPGAGLGSSPHCMPGAPAPMCPSCGWWAGPSLLITCRGRGLAGGSPC